MANIFKQGNPILHKMDVSNPDMTGKVFDLAKGMAEEYGCPIEFMDITDTKEFDYSKRVHTKQGTKRRRFFKNGTSTVAQWRVNGLSEDQFHQIEGVVKAVKAPSPIRSTVNEHGKKIRPGSHPNLDGSQSVTRRGYFIGRDGWDGNRGVWVTKVYGSRQQATKDMRRPGWLYGDGEHLIELREDGRLRHLTCLEYV
jgi:hypothetical protein